MYKNKIQKIIMMKVSLRNYTPDNGKAYYANIEKSMYSYDVHALYMCHYIRFQLILVNTACIVQMYYKTKQGLLLSSAVINAMIKSTPYHILDIWHS